MKTLTTVILVLMVIATVAINVLKKYATNQIGPIGINFDSVMKVVTNPIAIVTLVVGTGVWGLSMWMFSIEKASVTVLLTYATGIAAVLLSVLASSMAFKETMTTPQYLGLGLILAASVISTVGMYYVGNGGVQ